MSSRLVSHAVCLTAEGEVSIEMERVFRASGEGVRAEKVLELNPEHELIKKLIKRHKSGEGFETLAFTLYDEAALMALGEVDDPAAFVTRVNSLMK